MMQFTKNYLTLLKIIQSHCPLTEPQSCQYAYMYLQDCTTYTDFYIMYVDPQNDMVFALVDPLCINNVLDYEFVSFDYFIHHEVYFKVYPINNRPSLDCIKKRLSVFKK